MRIDEVISSSRAELYHGTTLYGAEQILANNVLKARMPVHNKNIAPEDKLTVSFSRSIRVADRHAGDTYYGEIPVILVFDGALLKRDYGRKMQPYDDMNTDWYFSQFEKYGVYPDISRKRSARSQYKSEAEEIIFGDITNVSKYITKIMIRYQLNRPRLPHPGDQEKRERMDYRIKSSPIMKDPRTVTLDKPE